MYRVTMTMCVAGDPDRAWLGSTGEDDTDNVPDDEWEDVAYDFGDDLDGAKEYVRGLDPALTTHVKIEHDGVVIFDQDAGADHLDDAHEDVEMPHTVDFGGLPSAVRPTEERALPKPPAHVQGGRR